MQIPKEELRLDILKAAEYEFLKRGYHSASLRTIAKKSNTTIGNLYHYFTNKEAILDAIVLDAPVQLTDFIYEHQVYDYSSFSLEPLDISTLSPLIEELLPTFMNINLFLSNVTIILLEGCERTKYANFRNDLYQEFLTHLKDHMQKDNDLLFIESILQSMFTGIIHIAKHKRSMEEGITAATKYMKVLLLGLIFGIDFILLPEVAPPSTS